MQLPVPSATKTAMLNPHRLRVRIRTLARYRLGARVSKNLGDTPSLQLAEVLITAGWVYCGQRTLCWRHQQEGRPLKSC